MLAVTSWHVTRRMWRVGCDNLACDKLASDMGTPCDPLSGCFNTHLGNSVSL